MKSLMTLQVVPKYASFVRRRCIFNCKWNLVLYYPFADSLLMKLQKVGNSPECLRWHIFYAIVALVQIKDICCQYGCATLVQPETMEKKNKVLPRHSKKPLGRTTCFAYSRKDPVYRNLGATLEDRGFGGSMLIAKLWQCWSFAPHVIQLLNNQRC